VNKGRDNADTIVSQGRQPISENILIPVINNRRRPEQQFEEYAIPIQMPLSKVRNSQRNIAERDLEITPECR
jgi:hypothetical protein